MLIYSTSALTLHWDLDQVPQSYYAESENTLEFDRRKLVSDHASSFPTETCMYLQFLNNDPVRTIQLTAYVAAALQEAEMTCGGAHIFNQYISKADPILLKQLQDELRGKQT